MLLYIKLLLAEARILKSLSLPVLSSKVTVTESRMVGEAGNLCAYCGREETRKTKGAIDFCVTTKGEKTQNPFYCTLGRLVTSCFKNRSVLKKKKKHNRNVQG